MSDSFDAYYKWLGIPPEEQPPHHYRLLGIRELEDDLDVISHAADQRMAHLRSLQSGQHAQHSQRLLNEIASAMACLLDADKKSAYDRRLRVRSQRPNKNVEAQQPPQGQPATVATTETRAAASHPELFGATSGSMRSRVRRNRNQSTRLIATAVVGIVLFVAIFLVLNFVLNSDDPQGVAARPNAIGKKSTQKNSAPTTNEAASGTGGDTAKDDETPHTQPHDPEPVENSNSPAAEPQPAANRPPIDNSSEPDAKLQTPPVEQGFGLLGYALRAHPAAAKKIGDHYYAAFPARLTWDEARQRCQAMGGYLVCIESPAEVQHVFKLARGQYVWLGGFKKDEKWRWVNGGLIEYVNWAAGEPNNEKGLEDRLILDLNGSWNDTHRSVGYVSGFICEWEF
ncbi:MAG: lectin-like protein [Planctomycetota bacterium]|nr:lectin-like protein [Planctomycetota bacterium]